MSDRFIVFDTELGRWVASVDPYDGDTDHVADRENARIFGGATWREFWDRPRYRAEPVEAEEARTPGRDAGGKTDG